MCDPASATLAFIAVSGTLTAGAVYQQKKAQEQALGFQRRQALDNQELANQQAGITRQDGQFQANRIRQDGRRFRSSQQALLASSGVDTTYGTAQEVLLDTTELAELDALQATNNAERTAQGQIYRGHGLQQEANLLESKRKNINPALSAVGSGLGSGAKFADKYYEYNGG